MSFNFLARSLRLATPKLIQHLNGVIKDIGFFLSSSVILHLWACHIVQYDSRSYRHLSHIREQEAGRTQGSKEKGIGGF